MPGCLKLPWAQASRHIQSPLLRLHNGEAVQTTGTLLSPPVECCDRQAPAQRSWTLSASWRQARKKLRAALRQCSASRPSCSLFGLSRPCRCLALLRQVRTPRCRWHTKNATYFSCDSVCATAFLRLHSGLCT